MAPPDTDADLLSAYAAGDMAAFEAVYERHVGSVRGFLLGLTQNDEQADELLQQAFVNLIARARRGPPVENVRAFLFTTARNLAHNVRREERVRRQVADVISQRGSSQVSLETCAALNQALAQLDRQQREIVLLHTLGELPFRAIGELLNLPQSTVHSRYQEALKTLERMVEP